MVKDFALENVNSQDKNMNKKRKEYLFILDALLTAPIKSL